MGLNWSSIPSHPCMYDYAHIYFTGLMAKELGSYVPAFYAVGGVIMFGSLLPFLLLWWKEESSHTRRRAIISVEHLDE